MAATATSLPAPSLTSIGEYLDTNYRPDREFVDGEIQERNLGEFEHGTLQAELSYWFRSHRDDWNIRVISEQRIRVSETRVRIPDICVIREDADREPVRVTPPLLCIEILSRKDRLSRTIQVMEDYLAMGVENLWIVDPINRLAYTYTQAGLLKATGARLEIHGTPIYLELPTLFAALD